MPKPEEAVAMLNISVDITAASGERDLARYSLGQGGLSSQPMIDAYLPQLRQLRPRTIRFFIQEYFGIYPAKGKYHWDILDKTLDAIVATGARPIPDICFKPALLYPTLDQKIVHPSSYAEWDELVYQLVKHCSEKRYGIEYWEIGNEVDLGEPGGCPYLFSPDDFLVYYKHTSDAVLRADPKAKVGGPALSNTSNPIGDALIAYCASGKAPLDFISYHIYNNSPAFFRDIIRYVRDDKLGKYPSLKNTEAMITEWNMAIFNPNLNPYFQPAFILEITRIFEEEGLSSAAYYEICDAFVDPAEFSAFLSPRSVELFADLFNVMPYFGLFDNQGRVRPAYFVFLCMSRQKGLKIEAKGTNEDVKSFSVKSGEWVRSIFWNFPSGDKPATYDCAIAYKGAGEGRYRILRLAADRAVNNVEEVRSGDVRDLKGGPLEITLAPYEIRWIELSAGAH
jgi:xylan 1,4-beta-xylosidase